MNNIDIDPDIDTVPVRTHAAARNRCDGCSPEYTWKWQGWPSGTLVDGPVFYVLLPSPGTLTPPPSPSRASPRAETSRICSSNHLVPQPNNSPEVTH